MTDDDEMSLNEIVEHVMRVTGRNRRQAQKEVLRRLASGELQTTGINTATGKRQAIPAEFWKNAKPSR
jgi:hypothetical protein